MKFCLISGKSGDDVKDIFIEEAEKIFDEVLYVPLNQICIECQNGKAILTYESKNIMNSDAIYVRIFDDDYLFGEIILDILGKTNIYMPTNLDSYLMTNHKYYSTQKVADVKHIISPKSAMTLSPEQAINVSKKTGFPIIIKLLRGFGGKGVMKIDSQGELKPVLDALHIYEDILSSQEFIPNDCTDTRALVVGDKIYGIKRKGKGDEWRANVSQGGSAEIIELDPNTNAAAKEIAETMNMDICAIDFIEDTDKNPIFIEANFTPGIMAKYFEHDLCIEMLQYIKKKTEENIIKLKSA